MKPAKWIPALLVLALLGSVGAAGPTQEETRWNQTLLAMVRVIAEDRDPQELASIASSSAFIAPFDMNRTESISLLTQRLPTRNVVSARAYIHPSVSSASDIVADLTAAGVDAETMRRLTPEDPAELRKADATMARWFASALEVSAGDPVAVLVLYDDGKGEVPHKPGLTFMLVSGGFDAAGLPHLSRVLYGSMESAVK